MTLLNYLKTADRQRYTLLVALPKGSALSERIQALDVPVMELSMEGDRSFDVKAIPLLAKVIRSVKADIVHTHGSLSGRIAAKLLGKRIVYTRHCAFPVSKKMQRGPLHLLNGILNDFLADRIIAVGPATRDNLIESGVYPNSIDVIMNGSEPLVRPGEEFLKAKRKEWNLSEDDFVVGILARIEVYKGHDDLLEATASLIDRFPQLRLFVVGGGEYEQVFREKAQKLLGERVLFTGFTREVAAALSLMDVQVNASFESETSSLSIIEGFSLGLPAIVSDCGGNPLLVKDGVNGFVFPKREVKSLADCIEKILLSDELREQMGQEAYRIYEKSFTAEHFSQQIEAIYEKVLKA